MGGSPIEMVEYFSYLNSFLSNISSCDKDCQIRIDKTNSIFGRLKPVWKNKHN